MIYSILTSLAVLLTFGAIVVGWIATVHGVRVFGYRASRLVSSKVDALQPSDAVTDTEQAELAAQALKRQFLKLLLVGLLLLAGAAALTALRNWILGQPS